MPTAIYVQDRSELEDIRHDERVQELMDEADAAEEANHQQILDREHQLCDALDECVSKGVSRESLKTLAMETGACTWAMRKSLKE